MVNMTVLCYLRTYEVRMVNMTVLMVNMTVLCGVKAGVGCVSMYVYVI